MKILKGFGFLIAILLFCIGMCIYSLYNCMQQIVSEQVVGVAVDKLIDTALQNDTQNLLSHLPVEVQEEVRTKDGALSNASKEVQDKLENVKQSLVDDKQVKGLFDKYSKAVLDNLEDSAAPLPDINADVEAVVEAKLPMVADAVGRDISSEEAKAFAKEISKKVDLQPYVESGMQQVQDAISPKQKQLLTMIGSMQSQTTLSLAIAFMGLATVFVACLKKSLFKWIPCIATLCLLGGGLVFAGASLANMLLPSSAQGLADGALSSLSSSGVQFIVLGIIGTLVYFGIKIFLNYKDRDA